MNHLIYTHIHSALISFRAKNLSRSLCSRYMSSSSVRNTSVDKGTMIMHPASMAPANVATVADLFSHSGLGCNGWLTVSANVSNLLGVLWSATSFPLVFTCHDTMTTNQISYLKLYIFILKLRLIL